MSEWPPEPPQKPESPPAASTWPQPPLVRAASPVPPPAAPTRGWPHTGRLPRVSPTEPAVVAFVPISDGEHPLGPPDSWPAPAPEPPRRRRKLVGVLAAMVAAAALIGGGVFAGFVLSDDDGGQVAVDTPVAISAEDDPVTTEAVEPQPAPTPIPVAPGPVGDDAEEPVAAVAAAVAPSVVRIDTSSGTGSGIVYDESGLVVTNAHVVGEFTDVFIQLSDGTRAEGKVLGSDPAVDVAVIQIDAALALEVAVFAPNSTVEVGQLAVAIGSPFGLEQSVTAGIISALNRAVNSQNVHDGTPTVVEMVQTDAPINPGNSGGALVDRQGRVVGMNTSIRTDGTTQGNLGVGFAIPSDTVLLVAGRIVAGDSLESGFLGISGQDPLTGRPGALVTDVVAGGPAESAGLESGDLIVEIDGNPVPGMSELAAKIRLSTPGTVTVMEVIRDGSPVTVEVTLGTLGQ